MNPPPDHPELVAADAEILDVGCGNGLLTIDLAKEGFQVRANQSFADDIYYKDNDNHNVDYIRVDIFQVVGVDYCAAAIKLAKQVSCLPIFWVQNCNRIKAQNSNTVQVFDQSIILCIGCRAS